MRILPMMAAIALAVSTNAAAAKSDDQGHDINHVKLNSFG